MPSSSSQHYPCLHSSDQKIYLFNCTVTDRHIICGAAYFDRLKTDDAVVIAPDGVTYKIWIPDRAKRCPTYVLMTDVKDKIELQRVE